MFNIDKKMVSLLKNEFTRVEFSKDSLFLQTTTPMGYDWCVVIHFSNTLEDFLKSFSHNAWEFDIKEEYKRMKSMYVPDALPVYSKLKPDLIWKDNKLMKCSNLLEYLDQQNNAIDDSKKKHFANRIPDRVVDFLNKNDITVCSLYEGDNYEGINEKFTRVWLRLFTSENYYCVTFMFNDSYRTENGNYRRYAFNRQFNEAINEQFGINISGLSMMCIKDESKAIAKLKEIAKRRIFLNRISEKLDRFYEENNDERKAS